MIIAFLLCPIRLLITIRAIMLLHIHSVNFQWSPLRIRGCPSHCQGPPHYVQSVLMLVSMDATLCYHVVDQSIVGRYCAPSLMAVLGQYDIVQWAGKAERRMPRLLCYWLMLVVNSLKCNSWTINLANVGRHAQLTRCFSAVAELLTRSSATAEKQRVSCACLPRLANWLCNALYNTDVHY